MFFVYQPGVYGGVNLGRGDQVEIADIGRQRTLLERGHIGTTPPNDGSTLIEPAIQSLSGSPVSESAEVTPAITHPVSDLGLPSKQTEILSAAGIETVEQITADTLEAVPGLSKAARVSILAAVAAFQTP